MPTEYNDNEKNPFSDLDPIEGDEAIWDLISLYVDGEATPEQVAQVETLLKSDPTYARDLEFLRATGSAVHSFVEIEPPATLRDSILNATTRRPSLTTRLVLAWGGFRESLTSHARYLAPVGALAAASLVGIVLWRSHGVTPNGILIGGPKVAANEPQPNLTTPIGSPVKPHTSPMHPVPPPSTLTKHPEDSVLPRQHKSQMILASNPMPPRPPRLKSIDLGTPLHAKHDTPTKFRYAGPLINDPRDNSGSAYADNDIQPGMDKWHQQMLGSSNHGMDADATDDSLKGPAVETASMGTSTPMSGTTVSKDNGDKVAVKPAVDKGTKIVYAGPLPPETSQILTNAAMKQQRRAETLGYDRDTVRSIQRHEVTISFFKGSL